MFDVETVFLYPWAVVVKQFGPLALATIGFLCWYWYLALLTHGGKERLNGSKKAKY